MVEEAKALENHTNRKMEILWSKTSDGAKIERVFCNDTKIELPETIEGHPVTEVGAYCFSSSEKYNQKDCLLTRINGAESRISEASLPAAAGKYLEEVTLSDSIQRLGNNVFYNCRKLNHLSFGKDLSSLGSAVFMNCLNLSKVTIRGSAEDKTGLPLILERIQTELEVIFEPQTGICEGRFFFPEINEWIDPMVTAHVYNRVIIGEGFRMRQCFHNRKLEFAKYDQCCAKSVGLEGDREICKIAMNRLRWPVQLHDEYNNIYEQAIRDRYDVLFQMVLYKRDMEELKFLCQNINPDKSIIDQWVDECIEKDWIEGNVYLMDTKHKGSTFVEKSFDFDDWE